MKDHENESVVKQITGAPNETKYEKGLQRSFLLFHIVLWSFKVIFLPASIIRSVRMG